VIVAALLSCGDSKTNATGTSHARLRADSVGGVLDLGAAPYNAVPGADTYPALQAAVNDSCAQSQSPWWPSIRIPEGTFPLSQTVLITCDTEILGASRHGTVLHPTFNGPALLIESSPISIATGPALVGSGNSFVETRPPAATIDLSDMPTVALDGLSAFTAEATFNVHSYQSAQGYAAIVTSQGFAGTGSPLLSQGFAFALGIANETQLLGNLTVNGTSYGLYGAATISTGTTHHAALTFDGTVIRLFLDGQVASTQMASGTITQRPYEDVTIGGTGEAFEGGFWEYPIDGAVDSVRLSNTVRYADTFVPPTDKFQPDASTLALENFDGLQPGLVRAWGGTTSYMLPVRGGGYMSGPTLHNFTIDGGMGVVGFSVWGVTIHAIDCLNCDYGFFITGPFGGFDDLLVAAGTSRGRYGILSTGTGGNEFNDIVLEGQRFPLVVLGSQLLNTINRVTVNPGEDTSFGVVSDQTDVSINGLTIGAGGDAYQAGLVFVGPYARPLVLNSNIAGSAGRIRRGGPPAAVSTSSQPTRSVIPVLVDTWGSPYPQAVAPIIQNTSFVNTQGDPEILDLAESISAGSILSGVSVDSNAPVSNDPNAITLAPMNGGPTTALPPMDPASVPIAAGSTGPGVFDVNAYGAAPNTSVSTPNIDSYPAIQAAVNAACAHGGGTLVLSGGAYSLSRPVLVNCNLEIDGPSMRWSRLVSGAGPALVLNPPGMTGIDEGPALIGSGHSMRTNGGSYWVNVREFNTELDGKGASTDTTSFTGFTAEAFVKMTDTVAGYAGIVQSAGCLGTPGGTLPGCTSAFQLGAMDGRLYGAMTLGGTPYVLQGPTLPLNAVHHVALSYDGVQTVRLLLDGHIVQTQTASSMNATLGQQPNEDVTVGPETTGFDGAVQHIAIPGYIDSVRLSRAAEYTGDFTPPTAKLVADGNTLVLLNFDDNTGGCTLGGSYYYPVRRTAEPDGTPEGKVSVTLNTFGFTYRSIFGANAEDSKYVNLYAEGDGFDLTGNSSGSVFDNITLVYGRIVAVNSSRSVFHKILDTYSTTSFVLYGGDHIQVDALTNEPGSSAQYGAYFIRTDVTLNGFVVADGNTGSPWKGAAVVDQPTAPFRLYKSALGGAASQATAAITIDGGQGYLIEGASFPASNIDAEIIHLNAPTSAGALHQAIGIHYAAGSTVSDDAALQLIGSGSQ
jgi:hypothetical protein